jgi:hypothetical protein
MKLSQSTLRNRKRSKKTKKSNYRSKQPLRELMRAKKKKASMNRMVTTVQTSKKGIKTW